MSVQELHPLLFAGRPLAQRVLVLSGNEAAARAILHAGYDGEGYFPITPSSEVGEQISRAIAAGESDMSFVIGTSELAAIAVVTGMAMAGGRAVDVTSSQGLLLKAEQMPAIAGLGLPVVMNLATREVSAPLNIKNGHSDLMAALGYGWLILCAPSVQAIYDLNLIALRWAEAVRLPVIVAYDGFHTSHAHRRIQIFADAADARAFVGDKPEWPSLLDLERPRTFGPYMNDDLINTKVRMDEKMRLAADALPAILEEYECISGRRYRPVEVHGDALAPTGLLALNTVAEAAKMAGDRLIAAGFHTKVIQPIVLRPWPEKEIADAIGFMTRLVVAERASQYGAGNYLANEVGATLQRRHFHTTVISRVCGLGGLDIRAEDGEALLKLALHYPEVSEDERGLRGYYGAWPGDPRASPPVKLRALTTAETTRNAPQGDRVDLKALAEMPHRVEAHGACPGCGIFSNLDLFLRGIDGQTALIFNTGCGMVVTTGYPQTSFRVPYFHNLFHNGTSTATGVVEMVKRFRREGKLNEEVTVVVVTGDGGDDIGMDQLVAAALRNDPFIVLEYDNKGYMNTGGQLCYTDLYGQVASNAPGGKRTHHKDVLEILRGTRCDYLFHAAESHPKDMIQKARRAQATVRAGGFAFGKVFSACPLNWGSAPDAGTRIAELAVRSCLHPLYEIAKGRTHLSFNPEKTGKKVPLAELFAIMGKAFAPLLRPEHAKDLAAVQAEVDARFARLVAMDASPGL